jgi:hypothetical protein
MKRSSPVFTISLKNRNDADTVCAVVRMDARHHAALKQFMHCKDEIAIRFPHGVSLFKRGRGWYRLEASNALRAQEKVEFAVKLIRRFLIDEERKTTEELKRLIPTVLNPGLKVATFSNAHSEGEFGYLGTPGPVVPASKHKLAALVARFAH